MIKIMIVVVILACLGPFFIKGPDGEPLLTLEDIKPDMPAVPDMPAFAESDEENKTTVTRVYKWQDDDGVLHFSNDPADAKGHEVIVLEGNINTMPSGSQESTVNTQGKPGPVSFNMPDVTSVAPEQISEMMDTVTNLQDTIDQRKADIDKEIQ